MAEQPRLLPIPVGQERRVQPKPQLISAAHPVAVVVMLQLPMVVQAVVKAPTLVRQRVPLRVRRLGVVAVAPRRGALVAQVAMAVVQALALPQPAMVLEVAARVVMRRPL